MSPQANPNARFGWREVKALQSPPPEIPRIGPTDVTPNRIIAQMQGERKFLETAGEVYSQQTEIDYKRVKAEREEKQKFARKIRKIR